LYEAARIKLLDLDRGDTLSRLSRSSPAALSRKRFETFDMNHPKSRTIIRFLALAIKVAAAQSSRLAELDGRGMSFNICRGTLGSLAMFTATRNASSRNSRPNSQPPTPDLRALSVMHPSLGRDAKGVSASHPLAFVVVAVYVALWLVFDPQSLKWQSVATVATWVMTLLIQRAEHRDTQAIHAKLDELLRAVGEADSDFATLDQQEPEEIEAHRDNALR